MKVVETLEEIRTFSILRNLATLKRAEKLNPFHSRSTYKRARFRFTQATQRLNPSRAFKI